MRDDLDLRGLGGVRHALQHVAHAVAGGDRAWEVAGVLLGPLAYGVVGPVLGQRVRCSALLALQRLLHGGVRRVRGVLETGGGLPPVVGHVSQLALVCFGPLRAGEKQQDPLQWLGEFDSHGVSAFRSGSRAHRCSSE